MAPDPHNVARECAPPCAEEDLGAAGHKLLDWAHEFGVGRRIQRVADVLEDQQVKTCLEKMILIQNIVDEAANDLFLEPSASETLRNYADEFLQTYARLAKSADEAGDLL